MRWRVFIFHDQGRGELGVMWREIVNNEIVHHEVVHGAWEADDGEAAIRLARRNNYNSPGQYMAMPEASVVTFAFKDWSD